MLYTVNVVQKQIKKGEKIMYQLQQFLSLERMTEEEIKAEIESAKEKYLKVSDLYSEIEEESPKMFIPTNEYTKTGKPKCIPIRHMPNLDILFRNLSNIENYIRKAENILYLWDDNRITRSSKKKYEKFNNIVPVQMKSIF